MERQYPTNREWTKNIKFNGKWYTLKSIFDDKNIDIVSDDINTYVPNAVMQNAIEDSKPKRRKRKTDKK